MSDLAVIASKKSSNFSLPSKTFTALATGTPILCIASKQSSVSNLIRRFDCGFVLEPNKNFKNIINLIKISKKRNYYQKEMLY